MRQIRNHLTAAGKVDVIAYCLMPNHYHLLVRLNTDEFSRLMQALSLSYTKAINKRYQRVGSLFQGRFQALHVDSDEYLVHLTRYIHLNPVRANLVARAEDWEFSSYPEYIERRQGTLPMLAGIRAQFVSAAAYQAFVEDEAEWLSIQHLTFEE